MNFNNVQLAGNIATDVTLRGSESSPVIEFRLAVHSRPNPRTDFFTIKAFGLTATTMAKYLAKGRNVFVSGRAAEDSWVDGDGQTRSRVVFVATMFEFIDRPAKTELDYSRVHGA